MKILPAITTIFDWREKVQEVRKLGLKEVGLFLTCLSPKKRQELYLLFKNTKLERIPFVHLRSDMIKGEMDFLVKNYYTEAFNIHSKKEYPYPADYKGYRNMIYIENNYPYFGEKELQKFAGICLDFGHLENSRVFRPDFYDYTVKIMEKYKCGCNHIGPAKNFSFLGKGEVRYVKNQHPHFLKNLSELDYLKQYPKKYFGEFAALEMENSIKEQLKARDYIIGML